MLIHFCVPTIHSYSMESTLEAKILRYPCYVNISTDFTSTEMTDMLFKNASCKKAN